MNANFEEKLISLGIPKTVGGRQRMLVNRANVYRMSFNILNGGDYTNYQVPI